MLMRVKAEALQKRSIKLHQIRDVVAVAECGSLRAAARQLGITQPAITRSIREIENYLGASLFERSAQGVVTTTIGSAFLRRASSIQSELARAKEEVDQMSGIEVGHVNVGLSSVPHLALLPEALPAFRKRFPRVDLTIQEGLFSRMQGMLEDGQLDFYVGPLSEENLPGSLISELLFENQRVIFGRLGHPLAKAKTLRELVDANWISTSVTHQSEFELAPVFEHHDLPAPRIMLHAQSALTMVLAAASSDLLTMLPRQWLQFPGISQLLMPINVIEPLAAPPIFTVRRRRLPLTPAAEYLYDMFVRAAADHT